MFRSFSRWLLLGLALAAGPLANAADSLQQKQQALDSVRDRISALQKKVESDQGERDQLSQDLQRVEQRVSGVREQLRSLQQRIDAQTQALRDTQQQQAEVQQSLADGRDQLARQLRAAYVLGRQPQTQLLLNLDDIGRVGRTMTYYDYLQRAQLAAIMAIHDRAEELEQLAARQQQEQAQLEQLRHEQQGQLGELQSSRAERSGVLQQIKQRIAGEQDNLAQLKADERSIRQLIESLKKALAALPPLPPDVGPSNNPFTQQKGKLPWPLRGPLLAQYGQAKADGRMSWNGHWIAGPAGAPVRAVAKGRAVYVGWMHRYGLIVLIEHEGGYFSLYGHCQSAAVAAGDAVRSGQVVAAAGDSGGHEQTGVYFEIRHGSEAVNPAQWLAR